MRGRGGGNNINGGGRGGGGPPADLLVCFPARARLALMPKPVCSPSRSAPKRRQYPSSRSATRGQVASPLFCRFKTRDTVRGAPALLAEDDDVITEPTSPKVTCAGQIKVSSRPKTSKLPASGASSGANKQSWLSVMEELRRHQRRHGIRGHSSSWLDALGLKKEAVHLLHGLRLRMRCFGSFRDIVVREDDQDDSSGAAGEGEEEEEDVEEEEEEDDQDELEGKQGDAHRTIFSKWFMLLEESPRDQCSLKKKAIYKDELDQLEAGEEEEEDQIEGAVGGCLNVTPSSPSASCSTPAVVQAPPPPPPANALLLMRCRSAPSKGWRPDGAGGADGTTAGGAQGDHGRVTTTAKKKTREDEKEKDQERLMLMSYAPDFFKVSQDIAKETWLVGSFDPLLRSRSWKR